MDYYFYNPNSLSESLISSDINTQNTHRQPLPRTDGTDPLAAAAALLTAIL